MRVVYMGTPDFSATILEELAAHHEVAAVYTRPDAVRGRGKALVPSPVKAMAESLGLPVLTPRTLRTPEAAAELAALAPDVVCVAAYGASLPKEILDVPPFGCLNVHGSLLPRWRGAAPIEHSGGSTLARCTTLGRPSSSSSETSASPVPTSPSAASASRSGLARKAAAAARTAFCSAGV